LSGFIAVAPGGAETPPRRKSDISKGG